MQDTVIKKGSMGRSNKEQRGFGLVGNVVLSLAVTIIATAGLYVFNINKTSTDNSALSPGTQKNDINQRATLSIKEWGIIMVQPSLTAELAYVMQNPDQDGVQRLLFSYKGLPELDAGCAPEKTDFGTLARFTPASMIKLDSGQTKSVAEIEKDPAVKSVLERYKKAGSDYYYLTTNSFKPYCGETQSAKDFLNKTVYTSGFISLSDPSIQSSIRPIAE